MTIKILSVGHALPDVLLSNDDLSKTLDTSDEWIVSRTGIKQRYIAPHGICTSDLAVAALNSALKNAGILANDLDGIIVATITPDLFTPSTAAIIQKKVGMKQGFAFDIQAACAGFIYALNVANSLILSGQGKKIAVIGAETMSRIINWQDRSTCVLFGDGAGVFILSKVDDDEAGAVLAIEMKSDGRFMEILKVPGGISSANLHAKLEMDGKEVYRFAVDSMSSSLYDTLAKLKFGVSDVDWVVAHQANQRILVAVASRLSIPISKVALTVDQHANTSAASIPLAFSLYVEQNKIKRGQLIALAAVGAGMTWGSALIKY